jgi:hypothetical protein
VLLAGCVTVPPAPVEAPAPPKPAPPSEELSVEDIKTFQACLILMGYEGIIMSGVESTATVRALHHYLQSMWGREWGKVSKELRTRRFVADCQEAMMRQEEGTPDF